MVCPALRLQILLLLKWQLMFGAIPTVPLPAATLLLSIVVTFPRLLPCISSRWRNTATGALCCFPTGPGFSLQCCRQSLLLAQHSCWR